MFTRHISLLACPSCGGDLSFDKHTPHERKIEEGGLTCASCAKSYPIRRGIPRFVYKGHYTKAFGYEWQKHARTEYDSHTGLGITEKRIFRETAWPRNMEGETILEAGCGSGRFTEQLLKTGATVVAFDSSVAVDANYQAHGTHENALIVQGDITRMPFKKEGFEKVLCINVLQHTPDPKHSLMLLVDMVASGGSLVTDIYLKHAYPRHLLNTRFWVRPLAKRLPPKVLYKICERYIDLMWPLAKQVHRLPYGKSINHKLLIPEFLGSYKLSPELHKEWTLLHLYDWLSPQYDYPQTLETYKAWFNETGLQNIVVQYGYGGVEGRGTKPK